MSDFRLLINGKLVEGAGTLDVINPATGRILTAAPRADRAQLDQAVAAAKTAFSAWSATPLRQRAALLRQYSTTLARCCAGKRHRPRLGACWESY
jgi:acyl-CoA reductase-like NAD-dependent aldehyde dehydrogenase